MDAVLQRLFDTKHTLKQKQLSMLKEKDKQALLKMIDGETSSPYCSVAMDAMVRLQPKKALPVLGRVLLGKDTPSEIRAVAATQLGRIGGADAEKALIDCLKTKVPDLVRAKAVIALGKTGTKDSIATLRRFSKIRGLKKMANFSLYLIAFRNSLEGITPPVPPKSKILVPDRRSAASFRIKTAQTKQLDEAIDYIKMDTYGISPSRHVGFEVECGKRKMTVVFDEAVEREGFVQLIAGGATLLGLIAERAPVDGSYSTRYVLLAWPIGLGKRARVAAYRTDGTCTLSGSLEIYQNTKANFEIHSIKDGANSPSQITGTIEKTEVVFIETVTGKKIIGAKGPRSTKL